MYDDFDLQHVVAAAELALLVSFVLGVVLHEAGHAVAAWLAGLDVRLVSLGQGPAVLRARCGRTRFVLRGIPASGFVAIAVRPGMTRSRYVAMVAGGPGVNAALLLLLAALDQVWPYYDAVFVPAAFSQVALLILSLTPWRYKARGGLRPSDGMQLWTQLSAKPVDMFAQQYTAVMRLLFTGEPSWPPASDAAPELTYQIVRSDRQLEPWARRDAVAAMRGLLGPWTLTAAERAVVLDFLASSEVLFGGTGASAAELDAWSAEACRLAPGAATTLTRAGVLATSGRAEQAMEMLLALGEPDDAAPVVGIFRYWLHMAQAAAARGWMQTVQRSLGMARTAAGARTAQGPVLLSILRQAERSVPLAQADWQGVVADPWGR